MNMKHQMRIGEPFNPWRGSCGFYAPDSVSRLRNVVILRTRHRLTDGHKNLYIRLVRRCGRDGLCYPSYESLASDLGRSVRQVKTWVTDLEAFGLIRHRRRGRARGGRGLANEYTFLWHPIFEVQSLPKLQVLRCNPGTFEVQDPAVLKCENQRPPYKEETRTEETHTLSSSVNSLRRSWPRGGWESAQDFETWWSQIVWNHPNKNRNAVAKTKALELVMAGTLTRREFDEGYSTLAVANRERWGEQNGRFVPNLSQLLDDLLWKFTPAPISAPNNYPDAETYLRRVENE